MLKKIIALTAALLLCVCLVACSQTDPDAPDGMQSVTVAGEPFRLYVPTNWSSNTASGVSGAYYSSTETAMVTARYYTPSDSAMTLDDYVALCVSRYADTLDGFTEQERTASVLGKENAVKMTYQILNGSQIMSCFQISVCYAGDMISLNGYCSADLYELLQSDFDSIIGAFVLCEKTDPQGEEVTDKHTPDGMEIASADHLEYRLYVPKTWICNANDGMSEAYYPESGKSNVSVTSYSPQSSASVQEYFSDCEQLYSSSLPGYERLSETERQVAGRTAYSYVYRTEIDGAEFRIMQTVLAYNGMFYSITYTALTENYDVHLNDVEAILNAFTFR